MIDFIEGAITGLLFTTTVSLLFRRPTSTKSDVVEEATCVGWVGTMGWFDAEGVKTRETLQYQTSCVALRSPTCVDGRCSYHCHLMCGCDKTERKP